MNDLLISRQLMMTQQILDIYADDIMALTLELVEDNGKVKILLSDEINQWSIQLNEDYLEKILENLKQNYYALKALNSLGFELAMNNFATIWSFKKYYNNCFVNVIVNTGNSPKDMLVSIYVHKPIAGKAKLDSTTTEQFLSLLDTVNKLTYDYDDYSLGVHMLSERITKEMTDSFATTIDKLAVRLSDFVIK